MNKTSQIENLKTTSQLDNNTIPVIETNDINQSPHVYLFRYTSQAVTNSWSDTTIFAKAYVVNSGQTDPSSSGPFILHWDIVASTVSPNPTPLTGNEVSIFAIVALVLSGLAIIAVIIVSVLVCKNNGYRKIN